MRPRRQNCTKIEFYCVNIHVNVCTIRILSSVIVSFVILKI